MSPRHFCFTLCFLALANCAAKEDPSLVQVEEYADHAAYFDPQTIQKSGDVVTLWTIWGPQDPAKRFTKGEMRLKMTLDCRTGKFRHDEGWIYVHDKRQITKTKFKPISGYASTSNSDHADTYVEIIRKRVC